MIIKLLGLLDLIAVLTLILSTYDVAPWRMVLLFSVYLMIKGYAWRGNIPSYLDFTIGVYLLMTIFFSSELLSWAAAIYLGIKGFQSVTA